MLPQPTARGPQPAARCPRPPRLPRALRAAPAALAASAISAVPPRPPRPLPCGPRGPRGPLGRQPTASARPSPARPSARSDLARLGSAGPDRLGRLGHLGRPTILRPGTASVSWDVLGHAGYRRGAGIANLGLQARTPASLGPARSTSVVSITDRRIGTLGRVSRSHHRSEKNT